MEPILDPSNNRNNFLPILYKDIWDMRQKHKASFWVAEEISLVNDLEDWEKLNKNEQHFIKMVLAFFYKSDFIVNDNLLQDFSTKVQIPELQFYYICQMFFETEHSLTYSLLLDLYIKDKKERDNLLNSVETIPSIKKKALWAKKWISNGNFVQRLIAFACVEGIFFSSSFCSIFWIKHFKKILHGLTLSNEYIARDEGIHRDTACLVYRNYIVNKLKKEELLSIVTESVEIEKEFSNDALSISLIGINSKLMNQYIEYCADHLLLSLINEKYYNTPNPFDWMTLISLEGKTNFFEHRVSQYSKAFTMTDPDENKIDFNFDVEF